MWAMHTEMPCSNECFKKQLCFELIVQMKAIKNLLSLVRKVFYQKSFN